MTGDEAYPIFAAARLDVWYRWVDDEPEMLDTLGATRDDLPVAVTPREVLRRCDPGHLAEVFDRTGPGGQGGTSSRMENYLGFPDGVSGGELTSRAMIQAQRFGALLQGVHAPVAVAAPAGGDEIMTWGP